jgi:pimeloyl-ACP methyl ester carboxylesterase
MNLIRWEDPTEVVLFGHSYRGYVVASMANRSPEKIAALVYVDAFVPQNGGEPS